MGEIRDISLGDIQIRDLDVPQVHLWTVGNYYTRVPSHPIVEKVGTPIINIPGCVEAHEQNKKGNFAINTDDENGIKVFCDASMPSFNAMNFEPEQLILTQPAKVPKIPPPPDADIDTPETPKVEGDPPCPGPKDPRIGDASQSGKEKVVGHELQPNPQGNNLPKICVVLYEDKTIPEQYLPSPQIVATTAAIAATATTSALLAKPLADALLKVVKPAVKKLIGSIQRKLGRTPDRPSRSEVEANRFREKKGLPPLKKVKRKKLQ